MQILFTRLPASAVQTWGTDVIIREYILKDIYDPGTYSEAEFLDAIGTKV